MELLIGDTVQYKHDDWSYLVLDINVGRTNGEVLYQCIRPSGELDGEVWSHTLKGVLEFINDGKISIIKRKNLKPIKKLTTFTFITKPNYH